MLTNFQNSLTSGFVSKLAISWLLKISPHLKSVTLWNPIVLKTDAEREASDDAEDAGIQLSSDVADWTQ